MRSVSSDDLMCYFKCYLTASACLTSVLFCHRTNTCFRYVSTLTHSQKIVLDEGLLFARGLVLDHQNKIENDYDPSKVLSLVPPREFGSLTLQKLLDHKIIFPVDRNENGKNQNKNIFVQGCSFPDYGEYEL